jgi:hypothetical protein
MENGKNNNLGVIFYLMELPINEKELNTIVSALRLGGDVALYQKLWTYKMDYLNKQNPVENN